MNIKQLYHSHSILFYVILFLVILVFLYFIFAIYVSFTLNGVIRKAINDEPYENSLSCIINEEDYELLNPCQSELEIGRSTETDHSNTFPVVLPFLTDAYYKYSYTVTDINTNEVIYGSLDSHVTIKLDYTSFHIHISEVIEAP